MSIGSFAFGLVALLWSACMGWAVAGWEATITLTSDVQETRSIQLVWGVDVSALDGLDAMDIPVPPPGQGCVLDAAFRTGDPDFPRLTKDIRQRTDAGPWDVGVGSDTADFTLSWDVSGVPADLSVTLGIGSIFVDMHWEDFLHLPQGTYALTLTVADHRTAASTARSARGCILTWAGLRRMVGY